MIRFSDLKTDLFEYFQSSLAEYYLSPAHKWLAYTAAFVLTGMGVFTALFIYDRYQDWLQIRPTFKGMYAWHTAANFAICLLIVDIGVVHLAGRWGAYRNRNVSKTWIVLIGAYLLGFFSQRIVVYRLVALYSPLILKVHRIDPSQRPGSVTMFLFMLPFWLIIGHLLIRMMLSMQSRSEELMRIRVDTILEERARHKGESPPVQAEPHKVDDHLMLPLGQGDVTISRAQFKYATVEDHYLRIHYQSDGKSQSASIRMPLRQLAAMLPDDRYMQIHRSYIVNLSWVTGVKRNGRQVVLTVKQDDVDLPVSRYRLPSLLPLLDRHLNPQINA